MKLLVLALGIFLASYADGTGITAMEDMKQSLREFSVYLYSVIAKSTPKTENIFFSPLSISQTLGMVLAGSGGTTFKEIEVALLVDHTRGYTVHNYKKLFKKIFNKMFNTSRSHSPSEALMANRMYIMEGYPIKRSYIHDLQAYFDANVVSTNFGDPEATADQINRWVANKTDNLITDLMDSNSIEPLTRLVLVNALFFKADWEYKTSLKGAQDRLFSMPGGQQRVPFMQQRGVMRYTFHHQFSTTWVEIPYEKKDAFLIIIMPSDEDAMDSINRSPRELRSYVKKLPQKLDLWTTSTVTVSWPKFSIDKTLDMRPILESMEVKKMFSESDANLTRITEREQLYVGTFKHKAKVIVNEEGTTAAAASQLSVLARSSFVNEIEINKPFFFAIYRKENILFFGRVTDPTAT